jgi:hypothetical protein
LIGRAVRELGFKFAAKLIIRLVAILARMLDQLVPMAHRVAVDRPAAKPLDAGDRSEEIGADGAFDAHHPRAALRDP